MKTNPLFYIIPILCATQMVYAASTPDKKMVDVIGPVKTVVTVIEEEAPDTLYLRLPLDTHELALASVFQDGDTIKGMVSFDKNGNFSHRVSLLDINAELDFSKHSHSGDILIEEGPYFDPDVFNDDESIIDAYKLWLYRGIHGEILEFGGAMGLGWSDSKRFIYSNFDSPLLYTYQEASDAYADCCAVYSQGWFENDVEIKFEDEDTSYTHLKTMVVSQHLGGQDLVPLTVSTVEYYDYEFDKYGNWITRKAIAKTFSTESPNPDYQVIDLCDDEDDAEVVVVEEVVADADTEAAVEVVVDQVLYDEDVEVEEIENGLQKALVTSWIEKRTITYYK